MRVNSEPLLLATPSGDALELRPAGPWVAANVSTLETVSRSVGADVIPSNLAKQNKAGMFVKIDLGQSSSPRCSKMQLRGGPGRWRVSRCLEGWRRLPC